MGRAVNYAILMLSLLMLLPNLASAQLKDNFELNVFGGGSFYTHKTFEVGFPQTTGSVLGPALGTTPIQGEFRMDRAIRGGVRVGVYTRGHWSEEFFYSYEPSTAHIIRTSAPTRSVGLGVGIHNYGITALYYLEENETKTIRPFLSIGVGGTLYRLTPEARAFAQDPFRGNLPGINNSNELTMNYGVGVKTRVSDWLGFRADVRGFLDHTPRFGLPSQSTDPNATVFPVSGAIHNGEASAGVVFYFFNRH
jgi:opacity protein-like surface antigen